MAPKPLRRALLILALAVGTVPPALFAQEADADCDRLNVFAAQKEITPAGVDLFRGDFRARCGDARMRADSAFVRERFGVLIRARLIRNVSYQDSTRSLTSDSLTYSGADDRVVAMGNVVLTMGESGARLNGPRVEFHRLTRSGAERTIATERPHLILEGDSGTEKPPTTIDADLMEIFREDNAWYRGDVVIMRPDAVSYADSAFFDMVGETGVLHGGARMDGEDFELSGDSIRIEFADDELRAVHAFNDATATGEGFDITSGEILVRFTAGEVDEVVAFGSRSAALSEGYHLLGDSLRFRLHGGAMDSTFAIGSAVALEDTTAGLGAEPTLTVEGDAGWLAGDTIIASFRRLAPPEAAADTANIPAVAAADTAAIAADTAAAVEAPESGDGGTGAEPSGEEVPRSELEQLRTVGNARAFYVAVDTTAGDPAARNYMIGEQIAIYFKDGKAVRVEAEQAIGVYLDPDPDAVVVPPEVPPAGADSFQVSADQGPEEAEPIETDGEGEEEPLDADDEAEAVPEKPRTRLPGDSP